MAECLSRDQKIVVLSLKGITAFVLEQHINPWFVLVQPRKTHPNITEKLLTGMLKIY